MAYILRTLLFLLLLGFIITIGSAYGWIDVGFQHIALSIPLMLFLIFVQAFIMFYFIGVNKLIENVMGVLYSKTNLKELFDEIPSDLTPFLKKVNQLHYTTTLCKRQTVPWTALILVLGIAAFLLGGAYHTGQVSKNVHVGVVLGFVMAFIIGFYKEWKYLGKAHRLLRDLKKTFDLADHRM